MYLYSLFYVSIFTFLCILYSLFYVFYIHFSINSIFTFLCIYIHFSMYSIFKIQHQSNILKVNMFYGHTLHFHCVNLL